MCDGVWGGIKRLWLAGWFGKRSHVRNECLGGAAEYKKRGVTMLRMWGRYGLGRLGDHQLLSELAILVGRGNALTADLLAHLAELDDRGLHLQLGFASLFAYCLERLRMSESAAGRRIAAARVCRKYPQAFAYVARGDLHLSAVCALGPHLSPDNASELFTACVGKSRRQVDSLLAERFPKPDVPDSIRRLALVVKQAGEVIASAQPGSMSPGSMSPGPMSPGPVLPGSRASSSRAGARRLARVEPLSTDRYGFHFTGDGGLRGKIELARALSGHRLASRDLATLVELAFDSLIRDLEKGRFAVGRKPRGKVASDAVVADPPSQAVDCRTPALPPGETTRRARRVPAAIAREVYERDGGRCAFIARGGRRCESRFMLELDHERPWALGGESTAGNLRLCCRAHNQESAKGVFGRVFVRAAQLRARPVRADGRARRGPRGDEREGDEREGDERDEAERDERESRPG